MNERIHLFYAFIANVFVCKIRPQIYKNSNLLDHTKSDNSFYENKRNIYDMYFDIKTLNSFLQMKNYRAINILIKGVEVKK